MPYTPVLATLGYVLSPDRQSVLMIHRVARENDDAYGKYNGLGGKLEPDEDVAAGMARELAEEAHIRVTSMRLRGTLSWPGFGQQGESWLAFVFLVDGWEGTPPPHNAEGRLEWVPLHRVLAGDLPMWPGDRLWIGMVFDDDPRPFHGLEPYDGLEVLADEWRYTRI